jgi:hypothetical protein
MSTICSYLYNQSINPSQSINQLFTTVRVHVIGATGYIGGAVCAALRKGNHRVYNLARWQEKANTLAKKEVFIVNGSVELGELPRPLRLAIEFSRSSGP